MREVDYERFEFHQDAPEPRTAPLTEFVLDVPYLIMDGVIPPLHVLNEVLASGGGDAGMSPGAGWKPFTIDQGEYRELVAALLVADLDDIAANDRARFVPESVLVDDGLEDSRDHAVWLTRVRERYRDPPTAGADP